MECVSDAGTNIGCREAPRGRPQGPQTAEGFQRAPLDIPAEMEMGGTNLDLESRGTGVLARIPPFKSALRENHLQTVRPPMTAPITPKALKLPNGKFLPLFMPERAPTLSSGETAVIAGDHKTIIYPNGVPASMDWAVRLESDPIYRAGFYFIGEERFEGGMPVPPQLVIDAGHSRTRNYVYYGGRGGAKSHQFAIAALMRAMEEKITILCCREIQSSMADSVHKLISEKIKALELNEHFEVLVNSIRCKLTGSEFAFRGLRHNLQDIKSFEGAKICWVEEAVNVSEESWDTLDPTIRLSGSEIWIGFNTDMEDDYTYSNFVLGADYDTTLVEVSYLENPMLSATMIKQAEKMRLKNPEKYRHIWGGQPRRAREGGVFSTEKISIIDAVPAGLVEVRGWDMAGTEFDPKHPNKDPDWTVGARMGRTPEGRFIITSMVRMRGKPHEVEETLVRTANNDGFGVAQDIPQDPGQAGKHQVQYFVSKLAGLRVHTSPESGDKVTRAEPFASQVNVGNVDMVRGPWNTAALKELEGFPNEDHDDIVDAAGRAFRRLLEPMEMKIMRVMGL